MKYPNHGLWMWKLEVFSLRGGPPDVNQKVWCTKANSSAGTEGPWGRTSEGDPWEKVWECIKTDEPHPQLLGAENEQVGGGGWAVWGWWSRVLPCVLCTCGSGWRVGGGQAHQTPAASDSRTIPSCGSLFARNFPSHPICCKNTLSEASAAGGHFCLPYTKK